MNITLNKTTSLEVGKQNRIYIPFNSVPDWFKEGQLFLRPLGWTRDLLVSNEHYFLAWAIETSLEDISVEQRKHIDLDAADLSELVIEAQVSRPGNQKSWPFTIPGIHRENGWLPGTGGRVTIRTVEGSVAIWQTEAYKAHQLLISKRWQKNSI